MSLLIGTRDGVYRSESGVLDDVERVLDAGDSLRVRTFEDRGTFAATKTGLFRSTDSGATWTDLGVPRTEVYSVVAGPDGARLFAGTHPAHLYVSTNHGETWDELGGFQNLPSRGSWHTPRHRDEAHVRSLGVHPDAPERVVAGVEVGGVHVGEDGGETWTERRDGLQTERRDDLQYDVHHILVLDADEWIVSCGGGLYRTRDAGGSWTRLDDGVEQSYFRETFSHRGVLYAGAHGSPGTWHAEEGVGTALFESRDGGDTLEPASYPGEPTELVVAWTAVDGRVLAGTTGGRVIVRDDGGWTTLGSVPAGVRSLTSS